ncbi:MAG: UvrD-helicase domain-containing protein [Clostridiales bacterium]|nr:UvrD-helicase domain-containing protein [Clostridiales bacterium]
MPQEKKIIIRDGMTGTYQGIPIIFCNVIYEPYEIVFSARKQSNNAMIVNFDGKPKRWIARCAFETGEMTVDNPEYAESSSKSPTAQINSLRQQRDELKKYFVGHVKFNDAAFNLDIDQLNAILSEHNTLVTARAGSGKTRVLIGKLIYLFEKQNMDADNVLAFCFNKDASEEINNRLATQCKIDNIAKYEICEVASTFHSYALRTLQRPKILEEKTRLIKEIINELKATKQSFSQSVYDFFRKDTLRIDRKSFNSLESYYKYLKNSQYTTLNNETVKSRLEKYIADFFFEHGIDYIYERSYYPYKISLENAKLTSAEIKDLSAFLQEKKEIVPDFYLPKYNIIWEHWAVTGNEAKDEVDNFEKTVGNYSDYISNKNWKQRFWGGNWRQRISNIGKYNQSVKSIAKFIETTHKQFNSLEREDVERELYKIMLSHGISPKKLPDEVLHEKAWKRCLDGFTKLIEQFINKLQQNYFDDTNLNQFIEHAKYIQDEKTKIFYRLGYQVYLKYFSVLSSDNNVGELAKYNHYDYDFNQTIYEASKHILNGELDEEINNIKWILIDEYQDFSKLFDYLIAAIISRNESIRVFCVGDDWQAINRYAGSDLRYFKTFASRYDDSKLLNIHTNYRSGHNIVEFANRFMDKFGMSGSHPHSNVKNGIIEEIDVSKVYIGDFQDENNVYLKYLDENERKRIDKAKYLKQCADIIQTHPNKKIMILNRSNTIKSIDLKDFNDTLKNVCAEFLSEEEYNSRVTMKTVHTAKGEESDVVILLDINKGVFPVFNPNNDLFEIFGQTMLDAIEDEQRLYYVALTRAKQHLYVLYEDDIKSPYIL